jgi:hypothetical protein
VQDDDHDDVDDLSIEMHSDGRARVIARRQTLLVLQRKAENIGMTLEEYIGQCLQEKLIREGYLLPDDGSETNWKH